MKELERILSEVPTWCSLKKAQQLYDLVLEVRPQRIVEIGVFGGGSLFSFGLALKKLDSGIVIGIDPYKIENALQGIEQFDEPAKLIDFDQVYLHLLDKIEREELEGYMRVIRDTSENVSYYYRNRSIDILHIDGNHIYINVKKDIELWLSKVKENGFIIIDDIDWPSVGAATRGFPELIRQTDRDIDTHWAIFKVRS